MQKRILYKNQENDGIPSASSSPDYPINTESLQQKGSFSFQRIPPEPVATNLGYVEDNG